MLVVSISGLPYLVAQLKHVQRSEHVAAASETDWRFHLGSPANTHYAALIQINVNNVSQLREIWRFDTHETGGLETTPVMIDGVLYAYTPKQEVIALDAATGALRWIFDSQKEFGAEKVTSRAERGLAYWRDGTSSGSSQEFRSTYTPLIQRPGKPSAPLLKVDALI